MKPYYLILSCEHASNAIPAPYQYLFDQHTSLFHTHSAYDIGAKGILDQLKANFQCKTIAGQHSRLLIDLNRTLNHNKVFSQFTKPLPKDIKHQIIKNHYLPYFNGLKTMIETGLNTNQIVLHLSVHSFTNLLGDVERPNDIGFLYDPKHALEMDFCKRWRT